MLAAVSDLAADRGYPVTHGQQKQRPERAPFLFGIRAMPDSRCVRALVLIVLSLVFSFATPLSRPRWPWFPPRWIPSLFTKPAWIMTVCVFIISSSLSLSLLDVCRGAFACDVSCLAGTGPSHARDPRRYLPGDVPEACGRCGLAWHTGWFLGPRIFGARHRAQRKRDCIRGPSEGSITSAGPLCVPEHTSEGAGQKWHSIVGLTFGDLPRERVPGGVTRALANFFLHL